MQNVELYAYLNIDNPMVAWEVAIGRIKSSCDRNPDNIGLSVWQYNMLKQLSLSGAGNRINNELNLEIYRQRHHADKVSRLNGVYFFESEAIAHQALERWNLARYKKYISKVIFSANRMTCYDSEWITTYMDGDDSGWYEGYLSGETLGVKPLTEILASGIGTVENKLLREQAYRNIMEKWPTSTPLLYFAIAGFCEAGIEDVALVRPFLSLQGGELHGEHIIYMESLELRQKEVAEAAQRLKERGISLPIILAEGEDAFFNLPDMREHSFRLSIPEATSVYKSMHEF